MVVRSDERKLMNETSLNGGGVSTTRCGRTVPRLPAPGPGDYPIHASEVVNP
ncbi:uncharacterized protein METZ01_LOCUS377971, partial [marine metagenome]